MDTARLLYKGPWLTERYLACQPIIDEQPEALLDVTYDIIIQGKDKLASDLFSAQYKLQAYKQITDHSLKDIDFMLTPTAGTHYTIDDSLAGSGQIKFQSRLLHQLYEPSGLCLDCSSDLFH